MADYDVLIIGGGPAGCTSGMVLARAGMKVLVLEKLVFPRFKLGESILPRNFPLVQELGLEEQLKALPHVPKYGAEFGMGDDHRTMKFYFSRGLIPGTPTFNIERAVFDKMLMAEARKAGADVREDMAVREIVKMEDGAVELKAGASGETFRGRYLLDCSGNAAVVGRHLGVRKNVADPALHKVAYFAHFQDVWRPPGEETGHPTIIMTEEGWFWLIGLTETKTSVGFVTHPDTIKKVGVPVNKMLAWAIARCPVVRERMKEARGPATNEVISDFSYKCEPFAGKGYFMVGDAACFLDPIFSTGVTLAMMSGREAARKVLAIDRKEVSFDRAREEYIKFVVGSTGVFWKLIRNYYRHSFRELFMNGQGPLNVHGAVISTLAGQVFPRPPFALRWRLRFFELCVWLQEFVPLCPRRNRFSLMAQEVEGEFVPKGAEEMAGAR